MRTVWNPFFSIVAALLYVCVCICANVHAQDHLFKKIPSAISNDRLQSILTDTTELECSRLEEAANGFLHAQENQQAYDTIKLFIEHCANVNQLYPWGDFGISTSAIGNLTYGHDSILWVQYREWLKSVLYLNTSDFHYYCSDVTAIMASMRYYPGRGTDYNGFFAILKYVIDSGKCPKQFFEDSTWYVNRRDQYLNWKDTVRDSIKTPFDTTLPNIDDLGLQVLRGNPAGVALGPSSTYRSSILSFTASPNPFASEENLLFTLNSATALRIEVYDALGKEIYGEPLGFRSEGNNTVRINASGWPPGTYYARLESFSGDVRTVKIVKN